MKLTDITNTTFVHHAYLLAGEREFLRAALFDVLENKCGITTAGNPDFWYGAFDAFGVDDAGAVKSLQTNTAVSSRRVFVIAAHRILHEAQNKLLKMLEEPSERTHFFLIVPHAGRLLPTVCSRMEVLEMTRHQMPGHLAEKFLKANIAERLASVAPIIAMEEGGIPAAIDFLNDIERAVYGKEKKTPAAYGFLQEIADMRRYLEGQSPSRKMILEHIALTAPRV